MRLPTVRSASVLATFLALASGLTGCPEKGAPADKTVAEPEQAEPDDQGKLDEKAKKPASSAPAAAAAGEEKKADQEKEEGGW